VIPIPLAILGEPRQLASDRRCSVCAVAIGDDDIPLTLFAAGDCDAWLYCNHCARPILAMMIAERPGP
jgi:hypothetical protein